MSRVNVHVLHQYSRPHQLVLRSDYDAHILYVTQQSIDRPTDLDIAPSTADVIVDTIQRLIMDITSHALWRRYNVVLTTVAYALVWSTGAHNVR